jgi:hypothetical protein
MRWDWRRSPPLGLSGALDCRRYWSPLFAPLSTHYEKCFANAYTTKEAFSSHQAASSPTAILAPPSEEPAHIAEA